MLHMLLPLDQHFDSGFGSVADSFKYCADALDANPKGIGLNSHLPISFLYRHAVELYLKSGIIRLHRKYSIPYGNTPPDGEPSIIIGQKRKPLYNIHNISPLYAEMRALLSNLAGQLSEIPGTLPEYWVFPPELDQWIAAIEETDSSSTFFRYPVTKDAERDSQKSTMQREEVASVFERMQGDGPKVKAMLMFNDTGEVVKAYTHDDTQSKEIIGILKEAAKMLHDMNAMMSYTLSGTTIKF